MVKITIIMSNNIMCRCGKMSIECVYTYMNTKHLKHTGILFHGKKDTTKKFVNKYNKKIKKLIVNGAYEHLQLCCGGDIATGLFTIGYDELFKEIDKNVLVLENISKSQMSVIQQKIEKNILDVIYKNKFLGYIKTYAVDVQKQYFSSKVQLYYKIATNILGNRYNQYSLGYLKNIYDLFTTYPSHNIVLQILSPNGSVSKYGDKLVQYKDLFVNFTTYGKVFDDEDHATGCIREVREELLININQNNIKCLTKNNNHIIYTLNLEKSEISFIKVIKEQCDKCINRALDHKKFIHQNNL